MNGIDISMFQQYIDWYNLDPNIKYCYIKATEGTTYQDPLVEENYLGARKILKVGFYHFLVASSAPETQAENFYNQIKDKQSDLIPMLDIEKEFFGVMEYALSFINKFKELSNLPIGIYTYTGFMDNLDNRLNQYPCWIANYNGGATPPISEIWGSNYVGHQYSDKGNIKGIKGNVDLNNFTDRILIDSNYKPFIGPVVVVENDTSTIQECKAYVGENCCKLQYMFNTVGYNLVCDDVFGENTYNVVVDYQAKKALSVDGKAGTNTIYALIEDIKQIVCGIKYRTPEATRLIQYLLNINIDGIFLKGTEVAVKTFQSANGLVNDGVVGQNTWGKLLGL